MPLLRCTHLLISERSATYTIIYGPIRLFGRLELFSFTTYAPCPRLFPSARLLIFDPLLVYSLLIGHACI